MPAPATAAEEIAYVGIGANLGDSLATVRAAIDGCATLALTRLLAASSLYRSAPIESSGSDYVNAVVRLATRLDPQALLGELQQLERRHGRARPYRNAPRTLDLDLLLFGARTIRSAGLTVPHPRMHLRAFVLLPLAEIDPTVAVPGQGTVAELAARAGGQRVERIAD